MLLALVALLVAVLFTSPLQTWIAQTVLDRQPGLQSSVGEVSVGFGRVKLADLHLQLNGAVLTLPSVEASLPLSQDAWEHRLVVRSLVAKGWTLDLSGFPDSSEVQSLPAPVPASGEASGPQLPAADVAAQKAEEVFHSILGGWKSPYDVAVDGVDLEGDVILNVSPEKPPVRVHVRLAGGGLAAGRAGTFTMDAGAETPWPGIDTAAVRGRIVLGMSSPRTLSRAEFAADLTAQGRSFPGGFAVSADLAANHTGGETTLRLDVSRGRQHLLAGQARIPGADHRVDGIWKVNLSEADLAPVAAQFPLPVTAVAGEGRFEADGAFNRVHVVGQLDFATNHLEVLAPSLARVGPVTLVNRFDLTGQGHTVRVNALEVSIAGDRPLAVLRVLRSFDYDTGTGQLQVANSPADWLKISVRALPLDWLAGQTGRFTVTGGDARGEFVIRAEKNGFALRTLSPLVATGLAVEKGGKAVGKDLDASLALLAETGPDGWRLKWDPLTLSSAGRRIASVTGTASRTAGEDKPVVVSGTWTTDLEALASQPALVGLGGTLGRSTEGEFTATVGSGIKFDGKMSVLGHDPAHTVTATGHADIATGGSVTFQVPFTLTFGKNVSEFTAEGNWSDGEDGTRIIGRLAGEDVDLDHLRRLAAPLATAFGVPRNLISAGEEKPGSPAPDTAPDRKPFWLGWSGEVTLAFNHLRSGQSVWHDVGGTFDFDDASIELKRGWFGLPSRPPTEVEASLTFDAAAGLPYQLKAAATLKDLDVAPYLGTRPAGQEPMLEGHFTIAATVAGNGRTLADLMHRAQEKYQVTGTSGIIRLLKTSVGDAFSEDAPSPAAEVAGTVGSWVGWLAGVKKDRLGAGEKKVGQTTENVLNLTSQVAEIGYDRISVTATRGYDRVIHLEAIEMVAPDERLTGSGLISAAAGQPMAARPLQVELRLGVRGDIAGLFSQGGLLSAGKDDLGYRPLVRALHFGGTLQQCDTTDWHDLLAKAATAPPPARK